MPSSTDHVSRAPCPPSPETALLEKIEQLSFIRTLNDRLARAPDFASACGALVDLVWEDGQAEATAYISVDSQRRLCRLEATAPASSVADPTAEFDIDAEPFKVLLAQNQPVIALDGPPPSWLAPAKAGRTIIPGVPALSAGGVLIGAVMRVRDAPTGVLLVYTRGRGPELEEARRVLAIAATSAALALDVARNESREEFLAMLRHDINNPITAALGYAELLSLDLESSGSDRLLGYARSVVDSLEAVVDLVTNYLHMTAIDRGVPWLRLEKLDLGRLVASVVDCLRPSATEKKLNVTCKGSCPSANVDRRQMGRVITNLVSNAIKYTPAGGCVDITVATQPAAAMLRVADTGYGLGTDDLPRLFTKYARFHQDKDIPGTGLGLYISKAIVEAHGGRIDAASEQGRGTVFTVRLPLDMDPATR